MELLRLTEEPTEADATSCRMALDRTKGFLGISASTVAAMDKNIVAVYRAMSDEELFPIGEKALRDIADDIIALDEIHSRFRNSKEVPILGYQNWKEFVARNSKYSIRTVQRRLADEHGVDESKINLRYKQPPEPAEPPVIEGEVVTAEVVSAELEPVSVTVEVAPAEPEPYPSRLRLSPVVPTEPKLPGEVTEKPETKELRNKLQTLRSWIKKHSPNVMVQIQVSKLDIWYGLEHAYDVQLANRSAEDIKAVCQTLQEMWVKLYGESEPHPENVLDALEADSRADVFLRKLTAISNAIKETEDSNGVDVVARLQVLEKEKKTLWDEILRGSQLDAENVRLFPDGSVLDDDATYRSLEEYIRRKPETTLLSLRRKEQSETRPLVVTSFPKTKIRRKAASGRIRKTKAASGCIRKMKAASGRRRKKTNGKGVRQ
jgi:hypothetical protein